MVPDACDVKLIIFAFINISNIVQEVWYKANADLLTLKIKQKSNHLHLLSSHGCTFIKCFECLLNSLEYTKANICKPRTQARICFMYYILKDDVICNSV